MELYLQIIQDVKSYKGLEAVDKLIESHKKTMTYIQYQALQSALNKRILEFSK